MRRKVDWNEFELKPFLAVEQSMSGAEIANWLHGLDTVASVRMRKFQLKSRAKVVYKFKPVVYPFLMAQENRARVRSNSFRTWARQRVFHSLLLDGGWNQITENRKHLCCRVSCIHILKATLWKINFFRRSMQRAGRGKSNTQSVRICGQMLLNRKVFIVRAHNKYKIRDRYRR